MTPTPAEEDHRVVCHIDTLLAARGITQTELAERMDLSLVNLSILKNNHARAIRFTTLTALCQAWTANPATCSPSPQPTSHRPKPATYRPDQPADRTGSTKGQSPRSSHGRCAIGGGWTRWGSASVPLALSSAPPE